MVGRVVRGDYALMMASLPDSEVSGQKLLISSMRTRSEAWSLLERKAANPSCLPIFDPQDVKSRTSASISIAMEQFFMICENEIKISHRSCPILFMLQVETGRSAYRP